MKIATHAAAHLAAEFGEPIPAHECQHHQKQTSPHQEPPQYLHAQPFNNGLRTIPAFNPRFRPTQLLAGVLPPPQRWDRMAGDRPEVLSKIAITGQLKEAKHDIPMVDNGSHDRVLFLAAKPFGYHSVCYAGCQVKGDLAACGLRHSRRGYFFASDISSTLELRLDMLLSKLGTFRFRSSLCCDLAGPIFSGTSQCVSILQERFLTCKANSPWQRQRVRLWVDNPAGNFIHLDTPPLQKDRCLCRMIATYRPSSSNVQRRPSNTLSPAP